MIYQMSVFHSSYRFNVPGNLKVGHRLKRIVWLLFVCRLFGAMLWQLITGRRVTIIVEPHLAVAYFLAFQNLLWKGKKGVRIALNASP